MESEGVQQEQGPCLICNQIDEEINAGNSSSSFPPFPGCPPSNSNSSTNLQSWSTFFIRRVLQLSDKECDKLFQLENQFRLQGANSSENLWFRTCSKCSESILNVFQMQRDIISLKLEMAKVQEEIVRKLKTKKRKLKSKSARDEDDIEVIDVVCNVRQYFSDTMLKPARKRKKYGFCETCMDTKYLHFSNPSGEGVDSLLAGVEKKLNHSLRCSVQLTRTDISSPPGPSTRARTGLQENAFVNPTQRFSTVELGIRPKLELEDVPDHDVEMVTEFVNGLPHNHDDTAVIENDNVWALIKNEEGVEIELDKENSSEDFENDNDSDYSVNMSDISESSNHGKTKKNKKSINYSRTNTATNKRKPSSDSAPLPKKRVIQPKPDGDVDVDSQPKPPFHCHICPFTVNDFKTFKKHMRHKHNQTYDYFYQCDKCDFHTDRYKMKKYHIRKHRVDDNFVERESSSGEPEFACQHCSETFKFRAHVRTHIRAQHGTELGVRSYKCHLCDKIFSNHNGRTLHVKCVHEKLYRYACTQCDARFKISSELEHHKWSHLPEDQSMRICDHCGLDFAAPRGLKRHLKLFHSANAKKGKKEVECSHCGIKLIHLRALKIHLRTAHLDQFKLKCPQCDEVFKCSKVLKYHIGTKHTNERYKCAFCQKIFAQVVNLRAHMKDHCKKMPADFDVGSFDFKSAMIIV